MKKLIGIFTLMCLMFFAGCDPMTRDTTKNYVLPEGLTDCKIYSMESTEGNPTLYVLRCPLSETTVYKSGDVGGYTTTVEIDTNGIGEYKRLKAKFGK